MSTLPSEESRGTFMVCEADDMYLKVGPNFSCSMDYPCICAGSSPQTKPVQGNSLSAFSILPNDYISKLLENKQSCWLSHLHLFCRICSLDSIWTRDCITRVWMEKSNCKSGAGGGGELPVDESHCGRAVRINDFLEVSTGFVQVTLLKCKLAPFVYKLGNIRWLIWKSVMND